MRDDATAVERQRAYFLSGATKSYDFRMRQLVALKRAVRRHENALADALKSDLARAPFEAYETDIGILLEELSFAIKHLKRWMRPRRVATVITGMPGRSRIYSEPYGVALIMAPWNYPLQLSLVPLVGAMAAGNCAIVKPSNHAPATADMIAKIIGECFAPEYIDVALGGREQNLELLEQRFDYIFFTGGITVGKTVMAAAAKHLTPLTLELGGKSPVIVDETADLDIAARRIVWGKCLNAGQTCVAPDYLFVKREVKEPLFDAMRRAVAQFYGGVPESHPDYVRIVDKKNFDRLRVLMTSGGEVVLGGGVDEETLKMGFAVIDGVTPDMPVMQEEIFGPLLPALTFDRLSEVVDFVNAGERPLALYIFSKNKAAVKTVVSSVPFGGGCVNDTILHLVSPRLPFGGVGQSGLGHYHGRYSFDCFSHPKSMLEKGYALDLTLRYPPYKESAGKLLRWVMK